MKPKQQFFIVFGGVLIGIIILIASGVWFLKRNIVTGFQNLRNSQLNLRTAEAEEAFLLEMNEQLRGRQNDLKTVHRSFYNENDFITYIEYIESLASKNNVTLTLRLGAQIPGDTSFYRKKFSLNASGSFANVITFLNLLEKGEIFAVIEQATISGSGEVVNVSASLGVASL